MPTGRHDVGVAADEATQRIYVVGGWNGSYSPALEIFNPGTPEVVWSSSNSTVASIGAGGFATGLTIGSSTITATSGSGLTGSTLLTVASTPPPTITTQPASQGISANGTATFTVNCAGGGPFSYPSLFN